MLPSNANFDVKLKQNVNLYSDFLNPDSVMVDTSIKAQMEIKRDYAWFLAEKSYEESYREFRRLYDEGKDPLSSYISAYSSDYHLNDLERAVEHYQSFADSFPDHSYFSQVDNRLKIIETDLEIQKAISQQGINYKYTVQFFHEEKKILNSVHSKCTFGIQNQI